MIQAAPHFSTGVDSLQNVPAGLSLPVPAHRARSRSTRSSRYVSRTIDRAALGTGSDSPAHSRNIRTRLPKDRQ